MLEIHLNIPDSLKKKLDDAKVKRAIQAGSLMAAKELEAEVKPYPGPAHHPIQWASTAQQRAYFAMRREQGLPMKYTRTSDPMSQRMKESWVAEAYQALGARLANSATYAPFVIGKQQQPFHKATGWKNLYEVADKFIQSGKLQQVFSKVIKQALGL